MTTGADERVVLGRLDGAWGVAGWVKVFSYTDPPQNIFDYQPWQLEQPPGLIRVHEWKQQGPRLLARLDTVDTREQAEYLRGQTLYLQAEDLPAVETGRYYWRDLIGLNVINREGEQLGRIRKLVDAAVHDVICVRPLESGADDLLIPFVMGHYVDSVELDQGRILVDWQSDWSDAD
ncbi:MAG: ribosome maturation factor RimM [Pseudomonadota bacterium]